MAIRRIMAICFVMLLVVSVSVTAFANEYDSNRMGSVSVTLTEPNENKAIVGAELSLYYIASVEKNIEGNLIYRLLNELEQYNISLTDSDLESKLDDLFSKEEYPSTKIITDEKGTASCTNMKQGVYFVKQTNTVNDYVPCKPFLVTLPIKNNEGYTYDVNASPKTEVEKLVSITVRKVWNTGSSASASESVTVQLLKNKKVIKTAVLNKQNNWQITYKDMPKSDAYSIKEVNIPKGFTATYKRSGYVFTVTNTSTLIQTGQLIWPIPILSVGGVLFIGLGIILLRKKREPNA